MIKPSAAKRLEIITPNTKEIRIHDISKNSQAFFYKNEEREIDIGFEAKA